MLTTMQIMTNITERVFLLTAGCIATSSASHMDLLQVWSNAGSPLGSTCRKSDCRLLFLSCSTPSSLGFLLPRSRQRAGSSRLRPLSLPSGLPPVVVLNAPLHEVAVRKSRLRLHHQLCTSEPAFCFFFHTLPLMAHLSLAFCPFSPDLPLP